MTKELSDREKCILNDAKEWIQGWGALCQYCPINNEDGCDGESELCGVINNMFTGYIDSYDINDHPWDDVKEEA